MLINSFIITPYQRCALRSVCLRMDENTKRKDFTVYVPVPFFVHTFTRRSRENVSRNQEKKNDKKTNLCIYTMDYDEALVMSSQSRQRSVCEIYGSHFNRAIAANPPTVIGERDLFGLNFAIADTGGDPSSNYKTRARARSRSRNRMRCITCNNC